MSVDTRPAWPAVRCFDSLDTAAFLRIDVNALNRESAQADPFSTFEYFEYAWQHHSVSGGQQGGRLWLLGAFSGAALVGYLALKRTRRRVFGLQVWTLSFLVTEHTDRPHVVARAGDLAAVWSAFAAFLIARSHEWSLLEFHQQDVRSPLLAPPADVGLGHYRLYRWPSLENCTIPVRWPSLHAYVADLPPKFRANLRRQLRMLLGSGTVELLVARDAAGLGSLFELYRSIESHSWKAGAGLCIGQDPRQIAHYRRLLMPDQPMQVSIRVMLLNGLPVAGLITGVFLDVQYALDIVFDERVGNLAPGSAMMLLGMQAAIDGGHGAFNLLSGSAHYKTLWLAEVTETCVAQFYRRGSLPHLSRLLGNLWRTLCRGHPRGVLPLRFNPLRRAQLAGETGNPRLQAPTPLTQEHPVRLASSTVAELVPAATLSSLLNAALQADPSTVSAARAATAGPRRSR